MRRAELNLGVSNDIQILVDRRAASLSWGTVGMEERWRCGVALEVHCPEVESEPMRNGNGVPTRSPMTSRPHSYSRGTAICD